MREAGGPLDRLTARRRLARAALTWERLWPALWPPLGVAGLFLTLALFGLPLLLPGWGRAVLAALFGAAFLYALWRSFAHFTLPAAEAADRRLESASGLTHRPLATLADKPAGDDPMALAIWQAHQKRARASIRQLRIGLPRPGLARRDPRALRAALALSLLAGLVVAGAEAPERLRRAVAPDLVVPPAPPGLRLEAWVTPPAYTGAAPIFLDPAGGTVSVPAGSRLQLALSGGVGGTPEKLGQAVATEIPKWVKLAKDANIKAD